MESVVAAQVQEARIPDDLIVLAAGNDRTQVVVDTLARHPAQPLERTHMPLQEGIEVPPLETEERRLRTRIGQRRNQRVDAPLTAKQLRPNRQGSAQSSCNT